MAVVIGSGVVLSDGGDINANNPLIGYQNLITTSNIAADSSDSSYPVTNLANPSTHLRWESNSAADQYITWTGTGLRAVDYIGIARHNFGTEQYTISVEAYTALDTAMSPDWEEVVAEFIPADDQPIFIRFETAAYLGVRLKIQTDTGASEPTIGTLYIGEVLVLQRRIYVGHGPMPYQRKTNYVTATSINGQFLGRTILGEKLTGNIEQKTMTPAWYRSYMEPFLKAARTDPFFFAWRPDDYPSEVSFAWTVAPPSPVNTLPSGHMAVSLDIEGLLI